MKKIITLLSVLLFLGNLSYGQSGNGHNPNTLLSYTPSGYTTPTYMRQDRSYLNTAKNTLNNRSSNCDLFVNFIFNTSGKNVFLVYTTDGTAPTKTNGTSVSCSFSKYIDPNRTFVGTIPSTALSGGNTVKYVFYISDGDLASAWGRVAGNTGYTTSWTEGDDYYSFTVNYTNISSGGNWSNASTWQSGTVPNTTDPVEIIGNSTVTLDQSGNVKSLNIFNDGNFSLSNNILTISSGGTFVNNGTFNAGTGTVSFTGTGTVNGSVNFYNVTIAGGVDFGSSSTINGTLTINSGGYVNSNPPVYGTGSTLKYNTGTTYGRNLEWSATSGAGYPYNVQISNNTSINLGANSGTGTERDVANNLTIDAGSALYMDYGSDDMTKPLVVNGNVTVNGALSLSGSGGGDIKLKGNLVFGSSSTFNANSRAVFFNGQTTQTVQATSATTYNIDYIVVGESGGSATTLQLVDVDIVCGGPNGGNALTFANSTDKIDLNGRKFTLGKAGVNSVISGSGQFIGSSTSSMEIDGTGDIGPINFDQTTPGTTNALKNLTIARTGGTVTIGNDVQIAASGVWTINSTSQLTVSGQLTNNAGNSGLVIQSDANGTGSLIVGSGTPAATVNRYLTGYTSSGNSNGWHLISAPVADFTIAGSVFTPASDSYDLYDFDQSNTSTPWLNYKEGTFGDTKFQVGKGYLVAYQTTGTKTFTGNINTGSYTENLSYTSGSAYAGWNLLGNPYTSAIDWDLVTKSSSSVNGTVYVLQASTGNYIDWNGSTGDLTNGIIPANQGFFVYTDATGQSITMEPADQLHSATNVFKSSEKKAPNTLKVSLKDAQNENDTYIQFRSDATKSFDNAIDGLKLFGLGSVSEIYTDKNGTLYSINCLPLNLTNYDLPIGVKIKKGGEYSLNFSGLSTFNNNMKFTLEDTQTGVMTDLSKQTTYDFSATKGDDPNRFVLHINGVTAVPSLKAKEGIHIYAYGNTIMLKGNENLNGKVSVFNTLGQEIYIGSLNGMRQQTIRLQQQRGIYFVKVEEASRVTTQKVFIR